MLEWIWFGILSTAAVFLSWLTARQLDKKTDDENPIPTALMFSLVSAAGALYLSWPVLGAQLWESIDKALPQSSASTHSLTVLALVGAMVITYLGLVLFLPVWLYDRRNVDASAK